MPPLSIRRYCDTLDDAVALSYSMVYSNEVVRHEGTVFQRTAKSATYLRFTGADHEGGEISLFHHA